MTANLSVPAQSLKSKLEATLLKHKNGTRNLPVISIDDPKFEWKSELNVLTNKMRSHNSILLERYRLTEHYEKHNKTLKKIYQKHCIAAFLYAYFGTDHEAITYLEEVYPNHIDQILTQEKEEIIAS